MSNRREAYLFTVKRMRLVEIRVDRDRPVAGMDRGDAVLTQFLAVFLGQERNRV